MQLPDMPQMVVTKMENFATVKNEEFQDQDHCQLMTVQGDLIQASDLRYEPKVESDSRFKDLQQHVQAEIKANTVPYRPPVKELAPWQV